MCAQASVSITAQNFLAPADDMGYKVEYKHPYFFGSKDPKRTALAVSIFNARKLSGVFTPGLPCPSFSAGDDDMLVLAFMGESLAWYDGCELMNVRQQVPMERTCLQCSLTELVQRLASLSSTRAIAKPASTWSWSRCHIVRPLHYHNA